MQHLHAKTRLTIYLPADVKKRLRIAAAKSDRSLRDYVLSALGTQLDRDVPPGDPLLKAAESGTAFWDNPADDEAWETTPDQRRPKRRTTR